MAAYVDCGEFAGGTDPVTITLGFEPKLVLLFASFQGSYGAFSGDNYLVCGVAKSSATNEAGQFTEGYSAGWNGSAFFGPIARRTKRAGEVISDINTGGVTGNTAHISALGATDFTIDFTNGNGSGSRYQWLAIGGDDVSVAIGSIASATATGQQAVTGVGFQPSFYMLIAGETGQSANGVYSSLGFCDGARQGVSGWHQFGNSNGNAGTPGDVTNYQRTTKVTAILDDVNGSVLGEAGHVSMDADGFTIDWTTAAAASETLKYIAVSGLSAHVGALTQPSATGTQLVSALDVSPSAVLFFSAGKAASTSVQNDLRCSIGLGKPSVNVAVFNGDNDNVGAIDNRRNVRYASNQSCIVHATPSGTASGTVDAEAAVVDAGETAGAGYFTLDWVAADATARQTLYLALGPLASGPVVDDGDTPAYIVTIDGDDINPLRETFRIQETLDAPDTLLCDIDSLGSPFTRFSLGQSVTVTENGVRIFGGYITGVRERAMSGPNCNDLVVEIQATSYEINAQRRVVTASFSPGSPSETLLDGLTSLVDDYYADVGVTLHPSQAVGPDLPYLSFERTRGDQVNRAIADALGYLYSIDFENRLRMWAPGDIAAPEDYDEDVNPEILTGDIECERQLQNGYANRVQLVGEPIVIPDYADDFVGDGVTDTWDITYKVGGPFPYFPDGAVAFGIVRYADGTTEAIGGLNAPGGFDWEYDPIAQTIHRRAGAVANGVAFSFPYHGLFIPDATAEDAGEIAQYGLWEHVEYVTAVTDNLSAQDLADAILAQKLASKDEIVTIKTRRLGYHPGQMMAIASPTKDLSGNYLLTQVDTGNESGGIRLLRSITAAKSLTNDHDWRSVFERWAGKGGSGSSAGVGVSSTTSQAGAGQGLHASNHQSGGIDPIKLDDLATPDDNTNLDVSTSRHGLVPKITGSDGDVLVKSGAGADWASVASAGGGNDTDAVAFGSEPASPAAGDLALYTDGVQIGRFDGASPGQWAPWGPIFPLTAPVDSAFAWVNQGGASVDASKGGIYLLAPAGAGINIRIRKQTAPATPYMITLGLIPAVTKVSGFVGLGFREASSGKLVTFGYTGTQNLTVEKFTNPTTYSANYTFVSFAQTAPLLWIRIADNGTNRICSWSIDGQRWTVLHTVGRTDFLTADEWFLFANSEHATWDAAMLALSLAVT